MMLVNLKFDTASFDRRTKRIAKQIPFAMSTALNMTAYDARDQLREDLPHYFTIRSRWVSKGIVVTRANKKTLTAEVGSRDAFMERQGHGGIKTGLNAGSIAIPRAIRKTKAQKTTQSRWPGRLIAKGNHIVLDLKSGDKGVFRIYKRKPPKLMYVLRKTLKVEKNWPFDIQVWIAVKKNWERNQLRAMVKALKTAK
jgi:hypothetical protein